MKRYSQNNEQDIILQYFGDKKGVFLDLGAYDGVELSNTRALMELGWSGYCFEPHPEIFKRLKENCAEFTWVFASQKAIGVNDGTFKLNANDTYYSTLIDTEMDRWKGSFQFKEIECQVLSWESARKNIPFSRFDFISIDCEGLDYEILSQINLKDVKCKMVCVETNGKETEKYVNYCANFGMKEITRNPENLIMAL